MMNQLLGDQAAPSQMANPMMPSGQMAQPNPMMPNPMAQPSPPAQPSYTPQELEHGIYHNKQISSMLAGLITNPNVTTKDALAAMSDAVKNGSMTAQQAATEAAQMPQQNPDLLNYLKAHFIQNLEMGRNLHSLKMRG